MSPFSQTPSGCYVFDTAIGPVGISWNHRGVTAIQLPDKTPAETLERILEKSRATLSDPPAAIRKIAARIQRSLEGVKVDFHSIPLDMESMTPFDRRVYDAARRIGPGKTATYGELAALAGSPGAARAVGAAMGKNPFPLLIPCHRVVAAGNKPGGFSAYGGQQTKARLLALEGVDLPCPSPANKSKRPSAAKARAVPGDGGLPFDWDAAVAILSSKDRRLARLIERCPAVRLETLALRNPYDSLAKAIVYQQLNGRAAATIFGRVCALGKRRRLPRPRALLEISDEKLRGAGLSRAKLAALRDLAAKTLDGTVPSHARLLGMSDEEIVERLSAIRGIGRWTVQMMLMFRLGRPDVLPVDDYGVRKGFERWYGLDSPPTPKELAAFGERWKPFRSVASWYMWRALELPVSV